ncbi:hypothetical protein BDZ97DRAFT_1818345 [Flammula alnicola]|nr:hypothetical protein BDZ97DRAFT_1818345 [Flammula alnicola]
MASSSLSSVVSNLVRASMGASVPGTVTDDDLDRHVAELIVREAKKKAERYGQQGIRAYISNNLYNTDDHNKTILRAQALAAQEVKREREEQERKQRRARAEEAAEAERLRRSGRSHKRKRASDDEAWDRWDGRTAERKNVSRNWEVWDGCEEDGRDERDRPRRRRRSRSSSRSRSRDMETDRKPGSSRMHQAEDEEEGKSHRRRRHGRSGSSSPRNDPQDDNHDWYEDDSRRRKRRRSRERSHRHSRRSASPSRRSLSPSSQTEDSKPMKRKRSRSPKYALDDIRDDILPTQSRRSPSLISESKPEARESELRRRLKDPRQREHRSPSPRTKSVKSKVDHKPVASASRRSPETESRSPSPGPQLPIQLPSKMDRYFEESYDPRLDVAPLSAPHVPATGLIDNTEFEGWDAMLELIRNRREDKEEKKRLERLGLLPPKDKGKSKKKGIVVDSGPAVADRWTGDSVSVMNIEYKKRGSVREWDMGKEGF